MRTLFQAIGVHSNCSKIQTAPKSSEAIFKDAELPNVSVSLGYRNKIPKSGCLKQTYFLTVQGAEFKIKMTGEMVSSEASLSLACR